MIKSVARLTAVIAVLLIVGSLTASCVVHSASASPPATVTTLLPAPMVSALAAPAGPPALTRPAGDWIVDGNEAAGDRLHNRLTYDDLCAHPGHLNGERIAVRIDHDGDPDGGPCPQGTYPGKIDKVVAGWIVSDPNASVVTGAFAAVICVNTDEIGRLNVLIHPAQRGTFHVGDPCPEGPSDPTP